MTKLTLSRRGFLAVQGSVVASSLAAGANASTPRNWMTAKPEDFSRHRGEPFKATLSNGTKTSMRLAETETSSSGWRRPLTLLRSEGVALSFECDQNFIEAFKQQDTDILRVKHTTLGTIDLMMTTVPLKSGTFRLEAILN